MPITAWVWVIVDDASAIARAIPKSITLTSPTGVSITLAGLMSRCTMPIRWLYSSAVSTPVMMSRAASTSRWWPSARTSRRVRPSMCSITMYGRLTTPPPDSTICSSPVS